MRRLLPLCAAFAAFAPAEAADLLIRNVSIVSPEREAPSRPMSVYIVDGKIAEIAKRPSRKARRAEEVIDGKGRFLSPGLIDSHTHLFEIPGMIFQEEENFPEIAAEARRQIPRSYLFHGFTTVIDLNSRADIIATWNAVEVRPQAYFCGAAPTLDGYPTHYLPKPLRYEIMPYFLADPARSSDFPQGFDPAEHTPEAVVARMHQDGAICVKTHYEPGFGSARNLPTPSVETVRAVVAAAHAREMPALLHANSEMAQAFGLEAGADAMAHGIWKWSNRQAENMPESVTRILAAVVERRIGWQPTFQVLYGERDLFNPDFLTQPAIADVVPQSLIDWYATPKGQWWRERMSEPPFMRELLEAGRWNEIDEDAIARLRKAVAHLAAHDGCLLFGSDTPSDPTYANPPGLNGRLEIQRWIDAGVTPQQLFRAATLENAKFFGLDREIGSVETGKRADLLLMTGNPLEDVAAFDAIEMVIAGGRAIPREELSAKRAHAN